MRGIAPTVSAAVLLLGACAHPPEHHSNRMLGATAVEMFGDARVAALAQAACDGDSAEIAATVRSGVDPNSMSHGVDEFEGRVTPLLWAIDCGNARGVEALLRAGADPNQGTGGRVGLTPVLTATDSRNPAVLRLLLQNGGNPNAVSEVGGDTALSRAFSHARRLESIGLGPEAWENWRVLLEADADINAVYHGQRGTIATFAANLNDFEVVVELLERGYSHDLAYLGFIVQPPQHETPFPLPPLFPEAEEARARAMSILAQRGVRFPVTRADAGLRVP